MSTAAFAAAPPRRVLWIIVAAQFACTSPWFAVNAVMADLTRSLGIAPSSVGTLTSAVQVGFIAGTLVFALLAISDRIEPRRVFLACALAAAGLTLGAALLAPGFGTLLVLRALTGFALAGIYPVGMRIAAGWFPHGLGHALGWLVGALVLGTALPYAVRAVGADWPWQSVMLWIAALTAAGGAMLVLLVPPAPHLPPTPGLRLRALRAIVADPKLRASVFGYFGHMWELYAMMVLVPAIVATRMLDFTALGSTTASTTGAGVDAAVPGPSSAALAGAVGSSASWIVFAAIAAGAIGCIAGGYAARRVGSARVAFALLATSAGCCVVAPWALHWAWPAFFAWLLLWGFAVAGDSPQFSALSARNAPPTAVGSILTLVNCFGFAISVATIQLFVALAGRLPLAQVLPWLAVGPVVGLAMLWPLVRGDRRG